MGEDKTGFDLEVGTVDEAKEMIGSTSERCSSAEPINRSRIQFYAGLLRDKNPSFWDEGFAKSQWGDVYAPLGMLRVWRLEPSWQPTHDTHLGSVSIPTDVPLPSEFDNVINIQTKEKYHRPARVGTRLHWQAEVLDVSEEKSTGLGPGHFITSQTIFWNDDGLKVGEYENVMLRHATVGREDEGYTESTPENIEREATHQTVEENAQLTNEDYESISVGSVGEGDSIPSYDYPITYRRVIESVAATRDFFPGHFDPEYARSQGNSSIYINTMVFQGLLDRLALDWAGPEWRVVERTMEMKGSAVVGDNLTMQGSVSNVNREESTIEIEGGVYSDNHDQIICPGSITISHNEA
jgi:acyl dehydratase